MEHGGSTEIRAMGPEELRAARLKTLRRLVEMPEGARLLRAVGWGPPDST